MTEMTSKMEANQGYVQTADFVSRVRSDHLQCFCKWSDFVSRHHQNICIGCYGNLSVTSQSSQWADSFFQYTDCCSLRCRPYPSACGSVDSASSLCFTPVILDLLSLLCLNIWCKQPEHLDWDTSVEIWFELHFKLAPNVVISKNHFLCGFHAVQTY